MIRLLDTDVLIDIRRGFPPAVKWFDALGDDVAVSGFTTMEIVQGCINKQGCQIAYEQFTLLHLPHQIGLLDCLIAQTSVENNLPLHTFNVKHYKVYPSLQTIQPYQR